MRPRKFSNKFPSRVRQHRGGRRHGEVAHGSNWHGEAGVDMNGAERRGKDWSGKAGPERLGVSRFGTDRHDKAGQERIGSSMPGLPWMDHGRLVSARRSMAGHGGTRQGRRGGARQRMVGQNHGRPDMAVYGRHVMVRPAENWRGQDWFGIVAQAWRGRPRLVRGGLVGTDPVRRGRQGTARNDRVLHGVAWQ